MNFKKFNGSTWETVRHKIYGSGTDSLTAFPAMIQASGEPLTDYTIYGNTLQNGTPTPEDPADVVGCGERTGNLIEFKNKTQTVRNVDITIQNGQLSFNGTANENGGRLFQVSEDIILESGTYRLSHIRNGIAPAYILQSKSYSEKYYIEGQEFRLTSKGTFYISFNFTAGTVYSGDLKVMLNLGSTALPYEPYGYKIPITVNDTERPIYLGQVEATRRISKIDLGTLNWGKTQSGNFLAIDAIPHIRIIGNVLTGNAICNMFKEVQANAVSDTPYSFSSCFNSVGRPFINKTGFESLTVDEFKEAMSGVYMWYVLEEPETGIVNEPLMKIGDYADTVSYAQAGVTIPTSDGDNTITFGTTVQPSGMSATFKGWHAIPAPKTYDGNDWR